jgi:lambda repressor-like predicted transcriptional regulator
VEKNRRKTVTPDQLREIVDAWVLGESLADLSRKHGRSLEATRSVLHKLKSGYTEGDKRAGLAAKLTQAPGRLNWSRSPTVRDRTIAWALRAKYRMPTGTIAWVLHLSVSKVNEICNFKHQPERTGGFFQ